VGVDVRAEAGPLLEHRHVAPSILVARVGAVRTTFDDRFRRSWHPGWHAWQARVKGKCTTRTVSAQATASPAQRTDCLHAASPDCSPV
jgi:hypothetical protein